VNEDLLNRLVAVVQGHYDNPVNNKTPLLLARFGQDNKDLLVELKAEFGTLLAAVRAAGDNRLRIVDSRVGRESMAPVDIAHEVELKVQEESANQNQSSSNFDSLPRAVQIAFCLRTDVGEHVALQVVPPFNYTKLTSLELLHPAYRSIPDHYRKPGLVLQRASLRDKASLWRAFVSWTTDQGIDTATFGVTKQTNALARFLAAQPSDVISRLVIPGDIADLLLKRP
jgi:hypothetical protein